MTEIAKKRPEFRNINAFTDLPTYRLPAAGRVSILHRISGVLMFALLPFIIWMFDTSISSEISFAKFRAAFNVGLWFVPAFLVKLVVGHSLWDVRLVQIAIGSLACGLLFLAGSNLPAQCQTPNAERQTPTGDYSTRIRE